MLHIEEGREGRDVDGENEEGKSERARASIVCLNESNGAVGPVAAMKGGAYFKMIELCFDHDGQGPWIPLPADDVVGDCLVNLSPFRVLTSSSFASWPRSDLTSLVALTVTFIMPPSNLWIFHRCDGSRRCRYDAKSNNSSPIAYHFQGCIHERLYRCSGAIILGPCDWKRLYTRHITVGRGSERECKVVNIKC